MNEFTHMRKITSVDQLNTTQLEQLRLSGIAYDGQDLPPAERVSPHEESELESVLYSCELWDVTIDGSVVFEAWLYQVDSGSIFKAGTTEMIAEIIQCGLECEDEDIELKIGLAMVQSNLLPTVDSEYERFSNALKALQ
ncbi:hypothetical protein [Streptomyces sp. NPDC057675]|uniref:hypothetical protein n=1 Tax=Streptomyces sp. NPDC057675 TaxID=3346204 RepID=UPI0036966AB7